MRFFDEKKDTKPEPVQYNLISRDFYDFQIIAIINQLKNPTNDNATCSFKDILAFNEDDNKYNGIKPDLRECFQRQNQNNHTSTEATLKEFFKKITIKLQDEAKNNNNSKDTNETLKNEAENKKEKKIYDYFGDALAIGIGGEMLCQAVMYYCPCLWPVLFFKYFGQTAYAGMGSGNLIASLYHYLGFDSHSKEIEKCKGIIQKLERKLDKIAEGLEHFAKINSLIKEIEEIKNNSREPDADNSTAYINVKAENAHNSNLFVLFTLCKYHVESYNYYYRMYETDKTDNSKVQSARNELGKAIKFIKKQSTNILSSSSIDTKTKLLFLVDVLKMQEQYMKYSFLSENNNIYRINNYCDDIFSTARDILKDTNPTKKINVLSELVERDKDCFNKLLEILESAPIKDNGPTVNAVGNNSQINIIVGDVDKNVGQGNSWCGIL